MESRLAWDVSRSLRTVLADLRMAAGSGSCSFLKMTGYSYRKRISRTDKNGETWDPYSEQERGNEVSSLNFRQRVKWGSIGEEEKRSRRRTAEEGGTVSQLEDITARYLYRSNSMSNIHVNLYVQIGKQLFVCVSARHLVRISEAWIATLPVVRFKKSYYFQTQSSYI